MFTVLPTTSGNITANLFQLSTKYCLKPLKWTNPLFVGGFFLRRKQIILNIGWMAFGRYNRCREILAFSSLYHYNLVLNMSSYLCSARLSSSSSNHILVYSGISPPQGTNAKGGAAVWFRALIWIDNDTESRTPKYVSRREAQIYLGLKLGITF